MSIFDALAIQCYSLQANLRSRLTLLGSAFPYQTLTASSSLSPLTKWSSGPAGPARGGIRLIDSDGDSLYLNWHHSDARPGPVRSGVQCTVTSMTVTVMAAKP